MTSNFSEIKEQAISLKESLEAINSEALSFSKSKESLEIIAADLSTICSQMQEGLDNSVKILEEIQSVSARKTVSSLKASADNIKSSVDEIITSYNSSVDSLSNTVADTAKMHSDAANMHSASSDKIKASVDAAIASYGASVDKLKKMNIVMGCVAVLCSVAAIMFALMP